MEKLPLLAFIISTVVVFTNAKTCRVSMQELYRSSYTAYKRCGWWHRSRCGYTKYRVRYRTVYRLECCRGYANLPDCQAVCSFNCNYGYCDRPEHCSCRTTHSGRNCDQPMCSWRYQCYPGVCSGLYSTCRCATDFSSQNNGCNEYSRTPKVTKCSAVVDYVEFGTLKNTVMATCSENVVYSNIRIFTNLTISWDSQLSLSLPSRPSYVTNAAVGIVSAYTSGWLHRPESGRLTVIEKMDCSGSQRQENPVSHLSCTLKINNDKFFLHRYILYLEMHTVSGGFKNIHNVDYNRASTVSITGKTTTNHIQIRFDLVKPVHCNQTIPGCSLSSGDEHAINVVEDITKNPIKVSFTDWADEYSGIDKYVIQFYKTSLDRAGDLQQASTPEHTETLKAPSSVEYKPKHSATYSILLTVEDKATNKAYARSLAIYDPHSRIDIDQSKLFHVTSATKDSGYKWVTSTQDDSGGGESLTVTWVGHFINRIQVDGSILSQVASVPAQFSDVIEDAHGRRTLSAIHNYNGIIKFEIDHGPAHLANPPDNWATVHPFREITDIRVPRKDGDQHKIWVRAHDVMGNVQIDSLVFGTDSSPPPMYGFLLEENVINGTLPYISKLNLTTFDVDSGIRSIGWTLFDNTTSKAVKNGIVPGRITSQPKERCPVEQCTCTKHTGECFDNRYQVTIDHCWMKDLIGHQFYLQMTSINQATLTTEETFEIPATVHLSGIDKYPAPQDIKMTMAFSSRATIVWSHEESCFEILGFLIRYTDAHGKSREIDVHPENRESDILDLAALTRYNISVSTKYTEGESETVIAQIETNNVKYREAGFLNLAGIIGGSVIGFIIIILLVVVIVLLLMVRRSRRKPLQDRSKLLTKLDPIYSAVTNKTYGVARRVSRVTRGNRATQYAADDELYVYGNMAFDTNQDWQISRSHVDIGEVLVRGKFADIYKTKWFDGRVQRVVIAKKLRDGATEEDQLLMKAKMNFHGKNLTSHENIVNFLAAVREENPILIMEFCEGGQLIDWLRAHKNDVTNQVTERLFIFIMDIAKGLEHLHSHKIIHRKLAARNVLLTGDLNAKVTGFGPEPNVYATGKEEKVPVKWTAPESMEVTRGKRTYTTKSDVWAYGVVMWEVFTLGETPYTEQKGGGQIKIFLRNGQRLRAPPASVCPDNLYNDLMLHCWELNPSDRPTMIDVKSWIQNEFFCAASGDTYYE